MSHKGHTPENDPNLNRFRRQGRRVLDLRDDGRWHDISAPGSAAGKGDRNRTTDQKKYAENYDKIDWSS